MDGEREEGVGSEVRRIMGGGGEVRGYRKLFKPGPGGNEEREITVRDLTLYVPADGFPTTDTFHSDQLCHS